MSISVIKAGICDTIQDLGRNGFGAYGINVSGAMDVLAMQCANALVINELPAAVLELHFPASVLRFNNPAIIAVTGADLNPILTTGDDEGIELPLNKTVFVPANTILSFQKKNRGERCYLSVQGGFELSSWLNSYSTNLKIREGGFYGRSLKTGDLIGFNKPGTFISNKIKLFPWSANFYDWYTDENSFNFIKGPEFEWLDNFSQKQLLRAWFTISNRSDRMGITLAGNILQQAEKEQLVSSGVVYGTMQLLPDGNIIILAADHPTTGGYPRIGHVISAHLPKLAQASPGTSVRFLQTTTDGAAALLFLQQKELRQVQQAVRLQMQQIKAL